MVNSATGSPAITAKNPRETAVISQQLMQPEHANLLGNAHGGIIMKIIDEIGAICAMRHSQRPVVTVSMDSMQFHEPIHVGDLVTFRAIIDYVGRTSMEVSVHVSADNPITSVRKHTNSAFLVYVALDDAGKPHPVPPLLLETDEDRSRHTEGERRQKTRLSARK